MTDALIVLAGTVTAVVMLLRWFTPDPWTRSVHQWEDTRKAMDCPTLTRRRRSAPASPPPTRRTNR